MKNILVVFGTRPEAIKMAPLVKVLLKTPEFKTKICVTAQHREMLDQVLDFFCIKPDYDLNLMKPNQTLNQLSSRILTEIDEVLKDFKPELVLVHGDTTTSSMVALASFHRGIKIGHIEAGLRTNNLYAPYPEEFNRQVTSKVTSWHFAPTTVSRDNLLTERVSPDSISVTGNTVIDALLESANRVANLDNEESSKLKEIVDFNKRILLVTGHRRENHGQGFINICAALKEIAVHNPNIEIVYPVHLNPNVLNPVKALLGNVSNIHLVKPLSYPSFVWLMNQSYLIITDSGGIQEEAPSLGKPVLVMRDTTERPEAVEAGTVILVGTDKSEIVNEANNLLTDIKKYESMSALHNPYGDGTACKRIVKFIKSL